MLKNRTVAKLLAATFVVSGVFMAASAPAQAQDSGWNGTRIAPTLDGHGRSGK
jgi:hypothetical protein